MSVVNEITDFFKIIKESVTELPPEAIAVMATKIANDISYVPGNNDRGYHKLDTLELSELAMLISQNHFENAGDLLEWVAIKVAQSNPSVY